MIRRREAHVVVDWGGSYVRTVPLIVEEEG